ncbi:erythrocyte membrane protein 1, PfEMP1,putative [Plasmodium sp.]|nr:erythrocyte membrane protein 1, PfEMP1,putative [Plasmodium sp.]
MTCTAPDQADLYVYTSGGSMRTFDRKCGHSDPKSVPVDDYIPQRLRWMTEWAEHYCKKLHKDYKEVKQNCGEYKCKEYKKHVKEWKKQWKTLKGQYTDLYTNATNGSTTGSSDQIQDQLHKFFEKLNTNTIDTKYYNLAEYITQTRGNADCVDAQQKKFLDNDKSDKEYAFRTIPHKYDMECKCKGEPCDVVETILKDKDGSQSIEECHPKDGEDNYPKWDCDENGTVIKSTESGACMPPRQTFFAWKKYKEDKQKENPNEGGQTATLLDAQLKQGKIPPEFLRIMYYTYGDFRDLCLGKDIGKNEDTTKISENIQQILKEDRQNPDEQNLDSWWKTIQKDVWKGMLCGLSHHIKDDGDEEKEEEMRTELTEKKEYQWFTEWSDEFCRKRDAKIKELETGCMGYTCQNGDENKKPGCEVEEDDDARDYIDKKLQELCKSGSATSSGNCDCMKDTSTKSRGPGGSMPKSLDQLPDKYDTICQCATTESAKPAPVKPAPAKSVAQQEPCDIVNSKLKGRDGNKNIDDCSPKDYDQWKCKKESGFVSGNGECMPPRRQLLCLNNLAKLSNDDKTDKLRETLIKCVAIETFFAWYEYQKNANDANKLKTGDIPEN